MILILFDLWSTQGWLGAFWSFWPKKALWVLWCSNVLHHVILDVLTALWRENYFFGFFGVRHTNQGRTKYGINSCPFFVWYLECNKRCRIKNVISYFVTPKLRAKAVHVSRPVFYLMRSSYCSCFWNTFWTWGQCLFFLFTSFFYKILVAILLEMHARIFFIFGTFISVYFCHAILGKMHVYIYIYIYIYNMRKFRC